MINKSGFIQHLTEHFSKKILLVQNEIKQLRSDISSDTKSTAGDKHETSRAMAQLEMEKLGSQLLDYQQQIQWIQQLNTSGNNASDSIKTGSFIRLTNGWYFLGLGIGKVVFENKTIFCVSIQSPLGKQLFNKKIGQEVILPNLNLTIESIN